MENTPVGESTSNVNSASSSQDENRMDPSIDSLSHIIDVPETENSSIGEAASNVNEIERTPSQSREATSTVNEIERPLSQSREATSTMNEIERTPSQSRKEYLEKSLPLYRAALKGDWKKAKEIIDEDETAVRRRITKDDETALHIASAAMQTHFVEELVELMTPEDLALQSKSGNTALCFAAAAGIVKIAEVMVNKNRELPMIRGSNDMTPLYMAALFGHSDMVKYLYNKTTNFGALSEKDRIGVLNSCIKAGIYDMAKIILDSYPDLALARDGNEETGQTALHVLAQMPSAFSDGNQLGIWRKFVNSILPIGMKLADKSKKQTQALQLLECLWIDVLQRDESEISARLLLDAAKLGNHKFLSVLIGANPDLIWKIDDKNQSIFHIAVSHRQETIFNMLHELGAIKDLITSYKDNEGNNFTGNTILHLAGMLAPPNRLRIVSGAAFQMQQELLWFKEVEKIVHPSYIGIKNKKGDTAEALFTEQHEGLVKEGEKWMKDTATSSMLVATLIATVVFAAAFTVPGGNNSSGTPAFLKKGSFMVFAISDAIALFTASNSILIFFSILTSRYREIDFLKSLPSKLMFGLTTLFISIINMMVAYGAAFFIIYDRDFKWLPILVALFACVPVIVFVILQYPLFTEVFHSRYGSRYHFKPTTRILFH